MKKVKILLADDHQIIRDGIRSLLTEVADFEVCGEASNGVEVIDFLENNPIDIVLMDINMPEMNGIEATTVLKEKFPKVKVLTLTMHDEDKYIMKMIQAGALGYILKNTDQQELLSAIKTLSDGNTFFSRKVSDRIMAHLSNPQKAKQQVVEGTPLTEREVEILKLIADGLTNQEIAEQLYISPRTVDTHRRNLLQKLGVKNTAGLVKYAFKYELTE